MLTVLENPSKEVLMAMHGISYLFALGAVGAIIAWIYYVAKAVDANHIGGSDGYNGHKHDIIAAEERGPVASASTMFEGLVLGVLVYFVFRHHYRNHY